MYSLDSCICPFLAPTAFFYSVSPFAIWEVPIILTAPVLFVLVGLVPIMIFVLLRAKRPYEEGRSAPALWVEATDVENKLFFRGHISTRHAGRGSLQQLIANYNIKGDLA